MAEPSARSRSRMIEAAVTALRADSIAAEVTSAFEAAGLPSILLKGRSFAAWLYRSGERAYRDCDLLIPADRRDDAQRVLEELSFKQFFDDLPASWGAAHASDWYREADRSWVDLHQTLPDVGVDPMSAWGVLSAKTDRMSVGGRPVTVLAPEARALHIVLHAAHHGVQVRAPMEDLERALDQLDESVWVGAAEVAHALDATDPFAVGLRLTDAGNAIADRLELPAGGSVAAILRAGSPPPVALGLEELAQANGTYARIRIVLRKFVPPPSFMRRWHPGASSGPLGLLRAYLERPIWILRATPRAVRIWRQARRSAAERGTSDR